MTATLAADLDYPFAAPPSPGTVTTVAPGIAWLRMPLPFALDHINLWLLAEPRTFTLVDTGFGDAATRALWESHVATTLNDSPLSRIIATHYHPDHLGNAQWLAERFSCAILMTHAEYLTAHAVHGEHAGYGVASTIDLFRRHGMPDADLAALAARGNMYRRGVPVPPTSFLRIHEGDEIAAGGTRWRVIEGHGHSTAHASLYSEDAGVLIAGDMLLPRISSHVAVWGAEPDGDPLARFLDSLSAFEALPPDTLVLPSHGLPFRGIALRTAQLRTHHRLRLAELEDAVAGAKAPICANDVLPVLFRRELDLQQRFFAIGEAIAHLNHLWRQGRLDRHHDAAGALRFTRPAAHPTTEERP